MICSYNRLIYPKTAHEALDGSYTVALYKPHEKLLDSSGAAVTSVKVVGYYLPLIEGIRVDMTGRWSQNAQHGPQFEMESYREVIRPTREGVVAYLSSGLIKGIGPKTAEKIYAQFGDGTLSMLDTHPESLLDVPGISKAKLKRICDSYIQSRGARDVVTFLAPFGVTPNRAANIFKHFGVDAIRIAREHPYQLSEMPGIGFKMADGIARRMGLNPLSPERISAGIIYTLQEAESRGSLCLGIRELGKQCVKLLETEGLSEKMAAKEAYNLLQGGRLTVYEDMVYRASVASAEHDVATRISEFLMFKPARHKGDLDSEIDAAQHKLKLSLAKEQRQAIKTCILSPVSIITGGPGTGKTMLEKVLLDIYRKERPTANIVCCAPTGRAARRMEQSTGHPASTIHKALGLIAAENGEWNQPETLDADLVLVDETSMLDIYLARTLLRSIPYGCQLVLIGDADQLPSVGPGAVLSELIASRRIPIVKLDKVYRQESGSRVAVNAALIRHNNVGLEYGGDFVFHESPELAGSAELLERLYLDEVSKHGIDNVALLTPFRQKSLTGVNALNERLRAVLNPPAKTKPEATHGKRLFRQGDKVMQVKNKGDVNNGDIGYIRRVETQDGDTIVAVDFCDGRIAEYTTGELDLLDLAYASTVHKAQGCEYTSVIINLQTMHYVMLKRPLIYTAVTRAKERVIIVGDRKALCMAINTLDTEKRGTMLASRIIQSGAASAANL